MCFAGWIPRSPLTSGEPLVLYECLLSLAFMNANDEALLLHHNEVIFITEHNEYLYFQPL